MAIEQKLKHLQEILKNMESILIAYSGGVDSTFLTKVGYEVLGERCLAVTAASETYTQAELQEAISLVKEIGVKHLVINTEELANEEFAKNPVDRCFYCKSELFRKLKKMAEDKGYAFVLDGNNADDVSDFRPGRRAAKELGVRSPLLEAGLTKEEIRTLSKEMELPTWNKPAQACLSSRFPYGHTITVEKLDQVEAAELFLQELGFQNLRVRHHGTIARIEVPKTDFDRLTGGLTDQIVTKFKALGFIYITMDLQGLRSGSMNEVLSKQQFVPAAQ